MYKSVVAVYTYTVYISMNDSCELATETECCMQERARDDDHFDPVGSEAVLLHVVPRGEDPGKRVYSIVGSTIIEYM